MRLVVFTTLFPRPGAPHHGVFVLERLRSYLARYDAEAVVIAPVPWIPRALAKGSYAEYADVPAEERRAGIRVLHPRYALLPKIGMSSAPVTLASAGAKALKTLHHEGQRFDLMDAHYLYPDAVAAERIARRHGLPVVVTARGSDLSLLPDYRVPRAWLRSMLRRASSAITVCQALADALEPLRPPSLPVRVLGNGVDAAKFRPLDRAEARARLGWPQDRPTVVSVGHLIERKGHHHLIEALPQLDGVEARILGQGPWENRLRALAAERGVADRTHFCGVLPHEDLHLAYSAGDVSLLLSSREGWPNVVLESLACGTPVVATRIWGTPEILREDGLGRLVDEPEPTAIADAVRELLSDPLDRTPIRRFAEGHSWEHVADGMNEVFEAVLGRSVRRRT